MTLKDIATAAADESTQRNFSDIFDTLMMNQVDKASDVMDKARRGIALALDADAKYRALIKDLP